MGSGGKGGSGSIVSLYYMSLHYSFCWGPVDVVRRIFIGEKDTGITDLVTTNTFKDVDVPGLYGGYKEGGGISGRISYMLGSAVQKACNELASRLGRSPDNMPGFRRMFSLVFSGSTPAVADGLIGGFPTTSGGFYWSANNPVLQGAWAEVSRWPKTLIGDDATIGLDANPAHIIHEALSSPDFGLAMPDTMIDIPSFLTAASTLRSEGFGLSLKWSQSTPIEDFIREILDHISASLAVDPRTGKLFLTLQRDDYDHDDLPEINPSNAKLTRYQRASIGDTINELVVTWTNPENEGDETVTFQDNANIETQGQVVSDSRNYYGVRTAALAAKLAARDLRQAAVSLVSCDAELDRTKWSLIPGDVVVVNWAEHGVTNIIMRVGPVDYGKPGDPSIKVSLLQDASAVGDAGYNTSGTQWEDSGSELGPVDHLVLSSAPFFMVAKALNDDAAAAAIAYPQVYTMIFTAQNNNDVRATDYLVEGADLAGNIDFYPVGTVLDQGRGTLPTALLPESLSSLAYLNSFFGITPSAGDVIFITDGTNDEICVIDSVTPGLITLRRGCLDTIPRSWAAGVDIWVVDPTSQVGDTVQRSVAQVVRYKFLPVTSQGQIDPSLAPINTVTMTDRQYRPYRPANVAVNGRLFGPLPVRDDSTITVTWSRRNRLTETTAIFRWSDSDATPEAGQTTTVQLWRGASMLVQFTGVTGTSQAIDLSTYPAVVPGDTLTVKVFSVRSGYNSLNTAQYQLLVGATTGGYGKNYGLSYGRI